MTTLSSVALGLMLLFTILSIAPSRGRNLDEAIASHQRVQLYRIGIVISSVVFLVTSFAKGLTP